MGHDAELINLQRKYEGQWDIWRSRRPGDGDDEPTGDWYASLLDPDAGVWPTVGRRTLADLDAALIEQAEARAEGRQPYDVGTALRIGE